MQYVVRVVACMVVLLVYKFVEFCVLFVCFEIVVMMYVFDASIAQLGERQTEDLKVLGSIPSRSILLLFASSMFIIAPLYLTLFDFI